MTLRELPPQVAIRCDECGYEMEHAGEDLLHVEPARADETARDHGWRVIDGRHVCTACQERKGQEVNE